MMIQAARSGAEMWTIDGQVWQIESTYYLALPEGLQYTIDTPVDKVPELQVVALDQAWPLIRYAYVTQLYLRSKVPAYGENEKSASRIGVSLLHRRGMITNGMRVAMSLGEIRERLESEKTKGPI